MILTSKDANKLLKKLNEELNSLQSKENRSKTFLDSTTEDPEKVRPITIMKQVEILNQKLRKKSLS